MLDLIRLELCHPDVEFVWPSSLPYGGTRRGLQTDEPTWQGTWAPFQPSPKERRMTPRIVAVGEDEIVVSWWQRGAGPDGDRFEGEVMGVYRLREGKLARAQMFYFDSAAAANFLARAGSQLARRST